MIANAGVFCNVCNKPVCFTRHDLDDGSRIWVGIDGQFYVDGHVFKHCDQQIFTIHSGTFLVITRPIDFQPAGAIISEPGQVGPLPARELMTLSAG